MLFDLILPFVIVLALFVLPGYAWATWLHRADRFAWPMRVTLGFIWSFALFSLLSGPFLWLGGKFSTVLAAVYVVWLVYGTIGLWLAIRSRGTAVAPAEPDASADPMQRDDVRLASAPRSIAYGLASVYGLAAVICLYLWSGRQSDVQERILLFSPLLLALGGLAAFLARRRSIPLLRFTAEDELPAPAFWTAIAVLLIVGQAVVTTIVFRPDWDDGFNLAAVRDFQEAPFLNSRDPISRDPGAVNATHRVLCLELWGSVLCNLTGADPQSLFHSLLPGLLVLACYAAYAALIGEVLPRRWVSLSLVGLSAYFMFGICGPFGGANHCLIRVWQGKSLLAHLGLPVVAAMLLRFSRQHDFASWATLVAGVCAALGFSTSAIFMGPALIGCLAIALLPSACGDRLAGRYETGPKRFGQPLKFLAAAAAACLPLVVEGLAILWSMRRGEQVGHSGAPVAAVSTARHFFHVWSSILADTSIAQGCGDLFWLFALPLLGLLLAEYRRLVYPVVYPLLLLLTAANPLFCFPVATYLTSKDAYYRLFWLLPIGPGLGMLFALSGRLASQAPIFAGRPLARHLPLLAALAGGLLLAALPGIFVWGPENNNGPFMVPRLGQNLQKMPPDLLLIAQRLERDARVDEHPILSGEEVVSFLTPSSSRFSYVMTRLLYLPGFGKNPEERVATEQYFLLQAAYAGKYAEELRKWRYLVGESTVLSPEMLYNADRLPALPQADRLPRVADLPDLVRRYRVDYIITSPPLWLDGSEGEAPREELIASRAELLNELGYREIYHGQDYSLWQR